MSATVAHRIVGPTTLLSVGAGSHAAVTISGFGPGETPNAAMFVNGGATGVVVTIAQTNAPASVVPADGASTGSSNAFAFVLPPNTSFPMVVTVPWQGQSFSMTAIGLAAGPVNVTVTPIVTL